ncbi:hypothetical protein TB2_021164 [Malus domestica]
MTVLSEIDDKTFFATAILAMRHPRILVLAGCLGALICDDYSFCSCRLGCSKSALKEMVPSHNDGVVLFRLYMAEDNGGGNYVRALWVCKMDSPFPHSSGTQIPLTIKGSNSSNSSKVRN